MNYISILKSKKKKKDLWTRLSKMSYRGAKSGAECSRLKCTNLGSTGSCTWLYMTTKSNA